MKSISAVCNGYIGRVNECASTVVVTLFQKSILSHDYITNFADQYMGCYKDEATPRDLDTIHHIEDLVPEFCMNRCRDQGYAYAGTQYSSSCLCGNNPGSKTQLRPLVLFSYFSKVTFIAFCLI